MGLKQGRGQGNCCCRQRLFLGPDKPRVRLLETVVRADVAA